MTQEKQVFNDFFSESGSENYSSSVSDSFSSLGKLSRKQKLMKFFLTSNLKNPNIWKSLHIAKAELIKNIHDKDVDVSDIHKLFWIYCAEDKDVFIPGHLKSFITQYCVCISHMPNNRMFALHEYLYILRNIRKQLFPFIQKVQPLLKIARTYAKTELQDVLSEDTYTAFESENTQATYDLLVKEKFSQLMTDTFVSEKLSYDLKRFQQKLAMSPRIWDCKDDTERLLFVVLGIHYYDQRNSVFAAFSDEQLQETIIFDLPKYTPDTITITREELLYIIEKIDFKNKLFPA